MLTVQRIQDIYTELERFVIQLDPDPRARGTAYLQDLIATCRNYLNDLDRILREIHSETHNVSRQLRLAETAFQLESDSLLANDERVKRLPSIEDRKATVGVLLRTQRVEIERLKTENQDLGMVDKMVRHQHKQLTATMSDIKLQRSIIDAEIRTGAMYGDERIMSTVAGAPINDRDLDAVFNEVRDDHAKRSNPPAPAFVPPVDDVNLDDIDLTPPSRPKPAASVPAPALAPALAPAPAPEAVPVAVPEEAPVAAAPDQDDDAIEAFLKDNEDFSDVLDNI